MANIEDYKFGKAAKAVKLAYEAMLNLDKPLPEAEIATVFKGHLKKLVPMLVNMDKACNLINASDRCAVGERLCKCEFPDAPLTSSVYLDELADAMVGVGKAEYAQIDDAIATLSKYRGKPLIVSKVSGKYLEICRSWPGNCFYWNMEKRGLKCLERKIP